MSELSEAVAAMDESRSPPPEESTPTIAAQRRMLEVEYARQVRIESAPATAEQARAVRAAIEPSLRRLHPRAAASSSSAPQQPQQQASAPQQQTEAVDPNPEESAAIVAIATDMAAPQQLREMDLSDQMEYYRRARAQLAVNNRRASQQQQQMQLDMQQLARELNLTEQQILRAEQEEKKEEEAAMCIICHESDRVLASVSCCGQKVCRSCPPTLARLGLRIRCPACRNEHEFVQWFNTNFPNAAAANTAAVEPQFLEQVSLFSSFYSLLWSSAASFQRAFSASLTIALHLHSRLFFSVFPLLCFLRSNAHTQKASVSSTP